MGIPFKLAEPGTDPTQQPNPMISRGGSLKDALPWILVLIAFMGGGYFLFIKPNMDSGGNPLSGSGSQQKAQASKAPTKPIPTVTPTLSATLTLPASPTPSPTPTPGNKISYGVYQDGQKFACWCSASGAIGGDDPAICKEHQPKMCED